MPDRYWKFPVAMPVFTSSCITFEKCCICFGKKISCLSSSLLWVVHEALKIQMKNSSCFSYFFLYDCLRNTPPTKGAGLSPCSSIPMRSRCLGAMAHRQRLGTLQECGYRRGPSASSLLGQGQWQDRAGQAVSSSSAQQLSAGPPPPMDAWPTRLTS